MSEQHDSRDRIKDSRDKQSGWPGPQAFSQLLWQRKELWYTHTLLVLPGAHGLASLKPRVRDMG